MAALLAYPKQDKRSHICPPSNATHPSGRWEALFVYSFICKFTNLRHKIEGLESPMECVKECLLEEALMSKEPNNILSQLLASFIVNLKPQTRNLSTDQISTTVASVLSEYFKTPEHTVFYDEELKKNVDPFEQLEGGFWGTDWDFKLKILRQLVELQLTHGPDIKATIDRAWGIQHNKHKKNQAPLPPLDPDDPKSRESLAFIPLGQDSSRKRFWAADDSPRLYTSTNPWKITASFQTLATTRDEYTAVIEQLKSTAPPDLKKGQKRSKTDAAHLALIAALEDRLESIDAETARVQKIRKRIEQKRRMFAQAEIRETRTRTRARTQKPDYVYNHDFSEDEGGDDYKFQDEEDPDEEYEQDPLQEGNGSRRGRNTAAKGTRRSTRNTNGKREGSSDSGLWRGERRSSRLAGPDISVDEEPARKRARTEDSQTSAQSNDAPINDVGVVNGVKVKVTGAAALKPTEVAMEQVAGKKKSKFWVYAVEPASEPERPPSPESTDGDVEMGDVSVKGRNTSPPTTNGLSSSMEGISPSVVSVS
ncbi:hypothetical protein CPB83DRAFT_802160 [Crepidotus variabilis]|uniref:WHIM1 domain-containing protein n=1 Tax=Crepidotus variabilis TaxID=179855 RepID=A0A9P6JWW1_9AGAR|nr:hypothetical protein CPB83DRAFT_802160 [Crepidotus variabilis]